MSGPQIVLWPIEDEYSWYPDIGEAIAVWPGDSFHYKVCEERAPETPDTDAIEGAISWMLDELVNSGDGEAEARIKTSFSVRATVAALAEALASEARHNKLWYPVGEVLTYVPDPDEDEVA